MTAEFGHLLLTAAFVTSLLGCLFAGAGTALHIRSWMRVPRAAVLLTALFSTAAIVLLASGFLTDDFSILNVARNSNRMLPWYYKLTAVWGSHEGSMLFWLTALTWWSLWGVVLMRKRTLKEEAWVLGVLSFIAAGLSLFILFTSNPFLRLFPPAAEGVDLNPLLQDPGMIFHPPLLYLGYVGFALPFAFALAALGCSSVDKAFFARMRPVVLVAWVFLTLGIALGSYWSYYELGWGGWWAWDPVENASLMPWLTATALLHVTGQAQKKGTFVLWALALAVITFLLSLMGTFLVRSGVISSVHAFASDPKRGFFILLFLGTTALIALVLFALRGKRLAGTGIGFRAASRASILTANSFLLTAAMGTVLVGTLYPLALETLTGAKISVGAPYFDAVFSAVMVPVFLLLVPGLVGCAKTDRVRLAVCGLAGLIGAALWFWAYPETGLACLGVFLAVWAAAGVIVSAATAVKAGHFGLRTAGVTLIHLGAVVTVFAAVAVSTASVEKTLAMRTGDTTALGDVVIRYVNWKEVRGPNYTAALADVEVSAKDGGSLIAKLTPEKRNYDTVSAMTMTEAAILHRAHEDVYVSLGTPLENGTGWTMRLYVKPFALYLWIGMLMAALGGVLALLAATHRREDAK